MTIVGQGRPLPLFLDRFFEVVPLDERHPDALEHSPRGEAVFPEGDDVVRGREIPRVGDEVVINNVLSARLGFTVESDRFQQILEELLRRERDGRGHNA